MWTFMSMENTWASKKCSQSMAQSPLQLDSPHYDKLCFYAIQEFSMLNPTQNQLNPIHTLKHCFPKIHFNIILQSTGISGKNCSTLFLTQLQLLYYQLKNYDNTKNYLKNTYPKNITRLTDKLSTNSPLTHLSWDKWSTTLNYRAYLNRRFTVTIRLQIHNTQKYIQK